jgi:hypothetical protein
VGVVIVSSVIGLMALSVDTRDECVDTANLIKTQKDPEGVFYCVPREEWDAGEKGMVPENEVG